MTDSHLDFPVHIGSRGRMAETDRADYIRDMIMQVLFTNPGERVNRPDFGCGIQQLVFMANDDALATATRFQVQGELDRWLGDLVEIEEMQVTAEEERLEITIVYVRRDTGQRSRETFRTSAGI